MILSTNWLNMLAMKTIEQLVQDLQEARADAHRNCEAIDAALVGLGIAKTTTNHKATPHSAHHSIGKRTSSYWATMSPSQRAGEMKRRMKVRAANRAAKSNGTMNAKIGAPKSRLTPAGRRKLSATMRARWVKAKGAGKSAL